MERGALEAVPVEGGVERARQPFGVLGDGGRMLVARVGEGEAAPRAEFAEGETVAVAHLGGEGADHLAGRLVRLDLEDGRTQVDVQAARVEAVRRQRRRHRPLRVARGDGEAELGVEHARRRLGVGVRIDAGREAQEHGLARAAFPRQPVEQGQLVEVVHGHAAHALVERGGQFGGALVVAVEGEAVGGEGGGAGHGQLAAAHHVHAQPFLVHDGGEGQAEPGLGRVEHGHVGPARAEFAAELARRLAEIGLVEHVQGGAVLRDQLAQVDAAQRQPSGGGEGGGAGQHVALGQGVERVHAQSMGARPLAPNPRPILRAWRTASPTSTSAARRAWSTSPARP